MTCNLKKPAFPPNALLGWRPEDITALLTRNDAVGMHAIGRALVALYERQTEDEQASHTTTDANGVGFSAFDAEIMTSLAEFYADRGYLTEKQVAMMRKPVGKTKKPRIARYARQLANIANAKVEHYLLAMEAAE